MKTKRLLALILATVLCICCLTGCGGTARTTDTPQAASEPEPSPEPTPDQSALLLESAEKHMAAEEYYQAYSDAWELYDMYPDSEAAYRGEAIMDEIRDALSESQPASGTELERTFSVFGGGTLSCTAESGPTEVTAVSIDNGGLYTRCFIRYGETADISLPTGVYSVTYKVGDVWFDDTVGFGDFCTEYDVGQDLDFTYSGDGAWISNTVWTVRLVAD